MQKLLLIALCLLPLSLFAQNTQSFEQKYGMSWEEMVARYDVSKKTTPAKVPIVESNNSSCRTLTPQEELLALKTQKDKIKENIKHLSLTIDSADPSLLEKYKVALGIKEKQIADLEEKLDIEKSPAEKSLSALKQQKEELETTLKKLALTKDSKDIDLTKKYEDALFSINQQIYAIEKRAKFESSSK